MATLKQIEFLKKWTPYKTDEEIKKFTFEEITYIIGQKVNEWKRNKKRSKKGTIRFTKARAKGGRSHNRRNKMIKKL